MSSSPPPSGASSAPCAGASLIGGTIGLADAWRMSGGAVAAIGIGLGAGDETASVTSPSPRSALLKTNGRVKHSKKPENPESERPKNVRSRQKSYWLAFIMGSFHLLSNFGTGRVTKALNTTAVVVVGIDSPLWGLTSSSQTADMFCWAGGVSSPPAA